MNKTIKALNKQLSKSNADISDIETKLQAAWNKVFQDSGVIKAMVSKVENSKDYTHTEYGDIASWAHVDLEDFEDCKPYFESYMRDNGIDVDWTNDAIVLSCGPDNLIIQNDTPYRRANGVWCEGNCVIKESEYTNDDNEVDTSKRNKLIESYMEKTGCYPGVFRCDSHGNVFSVNTQEGK